MMNFNIRRGGLRTLSEVSPTLGGRGQLAEIAPVLAAGATALGRGAATIGRGALKVAKHIGAGAAAGALAGGLGAAKGAMTGAMNDGPPSPPTPKFNWTR